MTLPAPQRPAPSWCRVRLSRRGTRTMVFLASSVALRIASGTSRALPWPKPTRPLPSPTTIRAANEKWRPPFTVAATRLMCTSFSTMSLSASGALRSRRSPRSSLRAIWLSLEVQAGFTRGVGKGLDAAVIQVGATVEDHLLDALFQGALGDKLADALGGGLVRTLGVLDRRGFGHGDAGGVVDDLGVDVLRRAEHRQAGAAVGQRLEADAGALGAPLGDIARRERHGLLLLAFLTTDGFARVADALALVGLGRTDATDAGGHFADQLLVDAADADFGLLRNRERDARRRRDVDVVAEAELHGERLALHRRTVADAHQLEHFLVAL